MLHSSQIKEKWKRPTRFRNKEAANNFNDRNFNEWKLEYRLFRSKWKYMQWNKNTSKDSSIHTVKCWMWAKWRSLLITGCQKRSKHEKTMAQCAIENSAYTKSLFENQQHSWIGQNECQIDNFNEHLMFPISLEPQISSAHMPNKGITNYPLAQWHLMLAVSL